MLTRWFPLDAVQSHEAKMLDVILYSRDQIIEERKAMADETPVPAHPWGIISVKAQVIQRLLHARLPQSQSHPCPPRG